MPRKSTLQLAALNIVTHPHSPAGYADLFFAALKEQRKPVKLRGDTYGMVRSCFPIVEGEPLAGLEGEIIRFLQIGKDEQWFNLDTTEEATKDDLNEIQIPDHLRPKLRTIRYVFLPKFHRLVFITSAPKTGISPKMAQLLIGQFLNHPQLRELGHPDANVTIEQSQSALENIWAMFHLRELVIQFHKPNHDESDLNEAAIFRELDEQHIDSFLSDFKADRGKSIKPNKRTKLLTQLAASNGYAIGKGNEENGAKSEINTEDHARTESFKERLDKLNVVEWLRGKANDFVRKITQANE